MNKKMKPKSSPKPTAVRRGSIRQSGRGPFRLHELLGWYGVAAILLAYGLLSFRVLTADALSYQLLNLSGAIGIGIEAAVKRDAQPVALNVVWALVAVMAIVRIVI